MSRSYRAPYYVCGYGTKHKRYMKQLANRKIRRANEVPDGKAYRKFFCSWNISDYCFRYNPKPRIRWVDGIMTLIEPEPLWKVNRK